ARRPDDRARTRRELLVDRDQGRRSAGCARRGAGVHPIGVRPARVWSGRAGRGRADRVARRHRARLRPALPVPTHPARPPLSPAASGGPASEPGGCGVRRGRLLRLRRPGGQAMNKRSWSVFAIALVLIASVAVYVAQSASSDDASPAATPLATTTPTTIPRSQ